MRPPLDILDSWILGPPYTAVAVWWAAAESEWRPPDMGCTGVRPDTRSVLTEARALYASAGYVEVERYNDNPFTQHWFVKDDLT